MRADFLLVADRVYVDKDGKVNIEGAGITHVRLDDIPGTVPRLFALARLLADEDDGFRETPVNVTLRWFRPDGTLAAETETLKIEPSQLQRPQAHPGEERTYFWIVDMPSLTFNAPGLYRLTLVLEGKTVVERPLVVFTSTEPAETTGQQRGQEDPPRATETGSEGLKPFPAG